VIRKFYSGLVLRDIISGASPKSPFLKKYCKPHKAERFQLNDIKMISYQIINALKFLHNKGVAHGEKIFLL